ncbi:DNA-processing protein DprA [Pseudomonas syringae]|uniref:DNA-processing protein DprA n=1 Tax=Pseudomonas syringae TaxID=317 RepID=UPI0003523488|nr:DNA-processing protein DprA [Pseudomonas syringae]EPF65936.1 DNA protecting DprA-like protein [Pseudomonas syringae pv. syringae SM]
MTVSIATRKLLTLSMLPGVGPATLKKVANIAGFEGLPIDALGRINGSLNKALSNPDAWSLASEQAEVQVALAEKNEALIISPLDFGYPALLSSTKDDPFILYVRGSLHSSTLKSVAIIGTREPTPHGQVITRRITEYFVENQWSIVSGLALGCDGLAHRAALDSGGHTVAVLAHGLQMIAPSQHKKLAEDILDSGGALISEYPFGQKVFPQQFVKRDRIQAGMAQGVVMIQSDIKGGSLHASRAALDYDRWLAVPLPTSVDRNNEEPKVMANLLIAEGEWVDKANLLKCKREKLDNILVLRTKDDYPIMLSNSLSNISSKESLSAADKPPLLSEMLQASESDSVEEPADDHDGKRLGQENLCVTSSEPLTQQNSLLQTQLPHQGRETTTLRVHKTAKKSIHIHNDISNTAHHLKTRIEEMEAKGERQGIALDITACLVMLAFTFESRLNFICEQKVVDFKERRAFDKKVETVLKVLGLNPDFSERPYSTIKELKSFRDTIAHGKPDTIEVDETVDFQAGTSYDNFDLRGDWEAYLTIAFTRQCSDDIDRIWSEWVAAANIELYQTLTHGEYSISLIDAV